MGQKLMIGTLGGTGIVGVLFVIGLTLHLTGISKSMGTIAIAFAIVIGIVLGLLGILGVVHKIVR